jgi:opacity protein-like surface antigen
LLVAALVASRSAQAEIYLSLSAGSASYETDAIDPPFDSGMDKSDTSITLGVGFQTSEHFAIEVGYADYGNAKDEIYREDFGGGFGYFEQAEVSMSALYVGVVGILPLGDVFSFKGILGVERWDGEGSWTAFVEGPSFSDSLKLADFSNTGVDVFYGVGISFSISPLITLSAMYDIHDFDTNFNGSDDDLAANMDLIDAVELNQLKAGINFVF